MLTPSRNKKTRTMVNVKITPGTAVGGAIWCFIIGSLYVSLSVTLHEHSCEDTMRTAGIVYGSLILGLAFFFCVAVYQLYQKSTAVFGSLIMILLLALACFGVSIWDWVVLLNSDGVACRHLHDSRVWKAQIIMNILFMIYLGHSSNSASNNND